MNDVADHEARFHDHGEQVDEPYPQQSEDPLRTGVAKITGDGGDGTYTIIEQVWTGAAWADGVAPGQYVDAAARDLNDSTEGSIDDLVFFWEQYTQAGVIELIISVASFTDAKVAVDCAAVPGFLGATSGDGVLRADCGVLLADGGDWITLYIDDSYIIDLIGCHEVDKRVAVDAAATRGYLGAAANDGVLRVGSGISYSDGGDFVTLDTCDEKVATAGGETPGYLENVIVGDGTWIELTELNGVITAANIGPGPCGYSGGCADGCGDWPIYVELDCIGNVRCIYMGNAGGCVEAFGPCA